MKSRHFVSPTTGALELNMNNFFKSNPAIRINHLKYDSTVDGTGTLIFSCLLLYTMLAD
ncbi:hypothetical protein SAMN05518672_102738 [Chitinophaga sp. CF118]|uniref:hypothetical protein n=1 Tax=Chitinophaga sp. CF118 TaxID=1884367 RepID=UPI0008F3B247|nr:hypothetical protein [Chitinophaga sp. CF118]SFD63896.1 hypothetical protein SAMN05518672_102738 [Chitinophaga sp. CF118]